MPQSGSTHAELHLCQELSPFLGLRLHLLPWILRRCSTEEAKTKQKNMLRKIHKDKYTHTHI